MGKKNDVKKQKLLDKFLKIKEDYKQGLMNEKTRDLELAKVQKEIDELTATKPEEVKKEAKKVVKPVDVKKFTAKSMTDGDLRMPSALRKRINWLKNHTPVTFEIIAEGNDSITLEIRKVKNAT